VKQPDFWSHRPDRTSWRSALLQPLSKIYAHATRRRVAKPGANAGVPVICVGNLNIGGTGKTPTVIALAQYFAAENVDAHIVSRGYGGSEAGPLHVNEREHLASQVGDEPLLLSSFAPVWIARDREAGVQAAVGAGAQLVIMDDGFQNPSVQKDLSIVVVDAAHGFGNGRVLPAGPLREPVAEGLKRADFVLSIGAPEDQKKFDQIWGDQIKVPRLRGELQVLEMGIDWRDQKLLAFAGIGHPEKFFQTIRSLGAELIHAEALSDHQPLTRPLLTRMLGEADRLGAQLVTTEKDAVRLPRAFRSQVLTLPVRLDIQQREALDASLRNLR